MEFISLNPKPLLVKIHVSLTVYNLTLVTINNSKISGADTRDRFSSISSWRGCYVIFHVKLLVFRPRLSHCFLGHVRAMSFFCDDLVSSRLGGFGIFPVLCLQPLKSHSRIIWTSKVAYTWVQGLVRSTSSTDHG
jgi:hypothetical protein